MTKAIQNSLTETAEEDLLKSLECIQDECGLLKLSKRRPYCNAHWLRYSRGQDMTAPIKVQKYDDDTLCLAPDCTRKPEKTQLCSTHYRRKIRGRGWGPPLTEKRTFEKRVYQLGDTTIVGKYIYVYRPDIKEVMNESRNLLPQHRVVYFEEILKRPFVKGENVHHINGDTHDNRIENLELWNTSQPSGQRVEDKVNWALKIINQYKPELLKEKNG